MTNLKKNYLKYLSKQSSKGEPFLNKIDQFNRHYLPLSNWIYKKYKKKNKTLIISLSGGQGSGKSTIAQILKIILKIKYKLNVICFSIDDYYKTLKERKIMSVKEHPLFITRGVPGTHDYNLLLNTFKNITGSKFKSFTIPKFDKSIDDRIKKSRWLKIRSKPDIVIFEGWCIGAKPQSLKLLKRPINYLEKNFDMKLTWRKKINNELKSNYKKIFNFIDHKIFLKVPNFGYVLKWRKLQEKKLRIKFKKKTMKDDKIKNFVMHYERVTMQMLRDFSSFDKVVNIDKKHRIRSVRY